MWKFLVNHPFASVGMGVGSFVAVATRVNDAYTLMNAGLPSQAWEAIGAAIFLLSVMFLLFRWERERETKEALSPGNGAPVAVRLSTDPHPQDRSESPNPKPQPYLEKAYIDPNPGRDS